MSQYKHSILGGTFDRLHLGHKKLIDEALSSSDKLTIGITSDEMASNKSSNFKILNFDTRKKELLNYLEEKDSTAKTSIQIISDIYGPGIFEQDVDAIFATVNTQDNAEKVIQTRIEKGLSKIDLIIVEEIKANDGKVLSSERIRAGEIDREGNSYLGLLNSALLFSLPDDMREELKKPYGEVIDDDFAKIPKPEFFITIGDVATANAFKKGLTPVLSVFDLKTHRVEITDKEILKFLPTTFVEIENPAGTITNKAIEKINELFRNNATDRKAIKIIGEEDLLTIPSVLLAPLGSILIYGLADIGAVKIEVNEDKKHEFVEIVKRMKRED